MEQLRAHWPHTLVLEFAPEREDVPLGLTRMTEASDPVEICAEFVGAVSGAPPSPVQRAVLAEVVLAAQRAEVVGLMRLHTLRMHAVGPFADEQVIDFDRLGAGGLFLFEGPTGVGKSTILDALTFALYGGLASESGDPARLRSDFAGPDDRPEVTLEFSVRGGRHRITRSPEYARPKKRGTGVTKEKASVHLERLGAGGWESRSHAKDEVGSIVGELLGLTREQFRQVVLLPQGEFATFLRAGDDERREVLGKLFGTQFFRAITESLQARAQEANRALQVADAELGARVSAACEAAGLGPDEHAELARAPGRAAARGAGGPGGATRPARPFGGRGSRARPRPPTGRREERWPTRGRSPPGSSSVPLLEASLAEAEGQRADHEARRGQLARAHRAIPVRPLVELVDGAAEQVATLRAAVVAASPGRVADPRAPRGCGVAGVGQVGRRGPHQCRGAGAPCGDRGRTR